MRELIKKVFFSELKKTAENVSFYKCQKCGFDSHTSEASAPDYCPKCGAAMKTAYVSETHVNS